MFGERGNPTVLQTLRVEKTSSAFTPKELRPIDQGCEQSELPWVRSGRRDFYEPRRGSVTLVAKMTQPFQG